MGIVSDLRMSVRKTAWPDGVRTFYDLTWVDLKGKEEYRTSQNFYEILGIFKELFHLSEQETEDPRDNEFMARSL